MHLHNVRMSVHQGPLCILFPVSSENGDPGSPFSYEVRVPNFLIFWGPWGHTILTGTKIFKVGPFWLDASGRTKILRVGPILPENMVQGTIFSSRNFGPRTNFSRTKIPVTDQLFCENNSPVSCENSQTYLRYSKTKIVQTEQRFDTDCASTAVLFLGQKSSSRIVSWYCTQHSSW